MARWWATWVLALAVILIVVVGLLMLRPAVEHWYTHTNPAQVQEQ